MDEDDNPELGVTEYFNGTKTKRFIYIFKYDMEEDRMIMWNKLDSSNYFLIGSRLMAVDVDGRYCIFSAWNRDGGVEWEVYFIDDAFYFNGVPVYMVSLPKYANETMMLSLSEEMRRQGYYGEAEANIEEVSYTYEELFYSIVQE